MIFNIKKLLFSVLCILSSAWAPNYEVVKLLNGESVTTLHFKQVPSLTELQNALTAINPELLFQGAIFEGIITNAKLIVAGQILDSANADELLAHNDEIGLFTHVDTIKLLLHITFYPHYVICEFTLNYPDTNSATQTRTFVQQLFYEHKLRNPNRITTYGLFVRDDHSRSYLSSITPYLEKIVFTDQKTGDKVTIIYNASVLDSNGARFQPREQLSEIYSLIENEGSLSSVDQAFLDLNNHESPGAWIIEE